MKFDSILSQINGFGRFQLMLVCIQTFSRLTLPCHFLLNNFMAAVPDHRCDISALEDTDALRALSPEQRLAVSIPEERPGTLSSCSVFRNVSGSNSSEGGATVGCPHGWVFDNSTFSSTVATEWDLVCSRKGLNKATATIFFIGVMLGAPLFGFLSDRYGRRPLLLVSYISTMAFALFSALSPSYAMFAAMRFFTGMSVSGISIIAVVLNVEWFSIERRTFSGIIISADWTVGGCLLVGIAYFVNQWRLLLLAVTSPLIVSVFTWRWLPESARWLLAQGRVEEAHRYISRCSRMNNTSKCMEGITPEALLESVESEAAVKNYSLVDLFRTPRIRKRSICAGIVWFGIAFTYYGISLNITGFGLSPHVTQLIFSSIELPMKILVYLVLDRVGRRPGEVGTMLLTGLCLFINMFVSHDQQLVRTVVAVLGKAMSEASFTIIYLYTSEFFPTVVRQNAMGYTSFLARLGVSISPLIMLLEDVWRLLPQVTYCAAAVLGGLVAMLLPETLNTRLPEFIEDLEKPRAQTQRRRNQIH